tara:strand:- start:57 stop:884 length:828 start_codon:yes stop_codon:yes gene_type:complete
MKTNLTVELTYVTPELASNLLKFNSENRTLKDAHVTFLSNQIKNGLFMENGEAIIFDYNRILKDGQHRLKAISINNKSFFIPIVRGVAPNSMATYDTGRNRTAGDILKLSGFNNSNNIAAFTQVIFKYKLKKSKSSTVGHMKEDLTNQQVLDFVEVNYDWMNNIHSKSLSIAQKMNLRVLSATSLNLITYLIGGENPSAQVYEFIKHLTGTVKTESSAPLYVYNKLYNSKINKEPLNFYWVLGMSLKAWNFYNEGNPAIKYFRFDVSQDLPTISI